jgi:hypothetical protein
MNDEIVKRTHRWKKAASMAETKVGGWELTTDAIKQLDILHHCGDFNRKAQDRMCKECCTILGIDPTTDTIARDIAEEIVLHGTPVEEVIAKLQRHLEGGQ